MKSSKEKDCYCYTCEKDINHLGIARHRAMHKHKNQYCKIMFSTGAVYEYEFDRKQNSKE